MDQNHISEKDALKFVEKVMKDKYEILQEWVYVTPFEIKYLNDRKDVCIFHTQINYGWGDKCRPDRIERIRGWLPPPFDYSCTMDYVTLHWIHNGKVQGDMAVDTSPSLGGEPTLLKIKKFNENFDNLEIILETRSRNPYRNGNREDKYYKKSILEEERPESMFWDNLRKRK